MFEKDWWSPKNNSASVRYEVSLSISGEIVWIKRPFKSGANPDLSIFREDLAKKT